MEGGEAEKAVCVAAATSLRLLILGGRRRLHFESIVVSIRSHRIQVLTTRRILRSPAWEKVK